MKKGFKRSQKPTPQKGHPAPQERPARDDTPLFETLRSLRREIADAEGIPAYMVFSDATLRDMAARAPQDEQDFLEVSGVGAFKLKKYGKVFLDKIAQVQERE